MTYATDIASPSRQLVYYIVLRQDRCQQTYGVAPCTATGGLCSYSWETCEDTANYTKTKREYAFCSKGALVLASGGTIPSVLTVSPIGTEISPTDSITVNARMEIIFEDDASPPPIDHDKGAGKFHANRRSTWWKLFVARNKNYRKRKITIYEGLPSYTAATQFQKKFTGYIVNIEFMGNGTVKVTASDRTKDFNSIQVPNPIGTNNTLQEAVDTTDTTFTVADRDEFWMPRKTTMWFLDTVVVGNETWYTCEANDWETKSQFTTGSFGSESSGFTYSPTNDVFYYCDVTFGSETLYKVDRFGTRTAIGSAARAYVDLAWDEFNGVLYAATTTNLYSLNVSTAAETSIGAFGGAYTAVRGLAWCMPSQQLFALNDAASDSLITVNTSTGVGTGVGTLGLGTITLRGLTHDPVGDVFYTNNITNQKITSIVRATGAGKLLESFVYGYIEAAFIQHDAYILIDSEYCKVRNISTVADSLTAIVRAAFGSTVASHAAGATIKQVAAFAASTDTATTKVGVNPIDAALKIIHVWAGIPYNDIDWAGIIDERDDWTNGLKVRRLIDTPTDADRLLLQLRQIIGGAIWQQENQTLIMKVLHPVAPHDTLTALTDGANIVEGSQVIDLNVEEQASRVVLHYAPADDWGGKDHADEADFDSKLVWVNADVETGNNFGDEIPYVVYNDWIFNAQEANALAARYLRRFATPPMKFDFRADRKDSAIEVGQIIEITADDFVTQSGADDVIQFQVLKKSEEPNGILQFATIDTRFTLDYGFINHTGAANYGAATALEKAHAYIGAAATPYNYIF